MASGTQNDIRVSEQLLHYFFGLQIPNVNHVIFRAGHDPLTTGDGKIGKNAILFISMAGVGLQTFAFGVIPQLQGVVERGGQNILAIG